MALSERDQRVLLVLPTSVVLLLYGLLFFQPLQKKLKRLSVMPGAATGPTASLEDVRAAKANLETVSKDRDRLKAELNAQLAVNEKLIGAGKGGGQPFTAIGTITGLLGQSSISLLSQDITSPSLTDRQKKAFENLQRSNEQQVEFRQFHVRARYSDMIQFLEEVHADGSQIKAYPVSLKLHTNMVSEGAYEWDLVIALL